MVKMSCPNESQLNQEKLNPGDLISEEIILEESNPEKVDPESLMSNAEEFMLEEVVSEEVISEEVVSEEVVSEVVVLEDSSPEEVDSDGNETISDKDLRTEILSTLELLKTPNAFGFSGTDPFLPNPVLYVPPHGILGLPLSTDDAQKIISQASQSPFGRGEETLIDTTVRKSWELNPNQFLLKNPAWNQAIKKILGTAIVELGLKEGTEVSAELYKLLLYEPGAFFKPHKDSEKAPGMFATLVVCLPSPHEGGKLVMTHENEKYEFDTANSSTFDCSFAAWYSDITHEVQPVVSGYRLMLTYNLIRQTDFEAPSYGLICGRVKQLSTLLEQYNSQLEKQDDKLPPVLLHKLEHKYTQANLKLNALKPPDIAQVQTLAQLSAKIGFNIYLATLQLEVRTDDDYEDYDYEEKSQTLDNIVELNGTLVESSIDYPDGALLDPTPQDEYEADEEEHEGTTGNQGSPATYWYRDTVVVLVPPSKQLNFVAKFQSNGVIKPLFNKLMQELSEDPAQKPKLEQLCELTIKQKPKKEDDFYTPESSESIPSYVQQAAATALDLGRIDLFDEACKSTKDKIMLDNAHVLGRWAANNGLATMTDRLIKGVRVASTVTKKVEFLKAVVEGFESAVPEPSSADRVSLKQWSDEAIFTAVAELEALTNDDGIAFAHLCNATDWSRFESKAKPIILKAVSFTKIAFIKELMSILHQELNEEQRSFIEIIIRSIWDDFVFDGKQHKLVQKSSFYSWESERNLLDENDILYIVKNTITILTSESVDTTIIPAMLTAIPGASKECAMKLFLPLVRMILKNELPGFRLPNDEVPLPLHKRLVQAFLIKYLLENVFVEPQAPANWSLPASSCICSDCSVVNRFLENPVQQSLDFPCSQKRRSHLNQSFKNRSKSTNSSYSYRRRRYSKNINTDPYDITIVTECIPNIWRITKHRRPYEAARSKWMKNIESITEPLLLLKKIEPVDGRLEAYLQPYYNVIMNAKFKELPELKSLVTMPQLSETDENTAPAHNQLPNQTSHKREASNIHTPDDELAKRAKL